MMRKVLIGLLGVLVLAVFAYLGAGYFVYRQLAYVVHSCDRHLANRPDAFSNISEWPGFDPTPYFITSYEDVRFPSRDLGLELAGWYAVGDPAAPAVVVVDGLGGCRYTQAALTPAGVLWRHGYNVLVIDLRDTGDSDVEDGYSAVGSEEYLDVLGAWDWLVNTQGFDPARVGIVGNSLGGATVLIAFAQEPRVPAIFLNSPFANLPQIMREELGRVGYPGLLATPAVLMARLVNGDNIVAFNPLDMLGRAGDRPVFILHSRTDQRVPVHHSEQLEAVAKANGLHATFWYVDEADHMRVPALYPDEFQTRLVEFMDTALGSTAQAVR